MIRFHKHKKAQTKIKNMYGKHLRGKELLILYLLFMLLLSCAFMLFSAFLCFFLLVKSYHKKKINKQKVYNCPNDLNYITTKIYPITSMNLFNHNLF